MQKKYPLGMAALGIAYLLSDAAVGYGTNTIDEGYPSVVETSDYYYGKNKNKQRKNQLAGIAACAPSKVEENSEYPYFDENEFENIIQV